MYMAHIQLLMRYEAKSTSMDLESINFDIFALAQFQFSHPQSPQRTHRMMKFARIAMIDHTTLFD